MSSSSSISSKMFVLIELVEEQGKLVFHFVDFLPVNSRVSVGFQMAF